MGSDIFEINESGARLRLWLGVDTMTAFMLAAAIFLGISMALILYSKIN